jgi:hypothetical protein
MMQAYKTADLYNKYVQEQASEAFRTGNIGADSYRNILKSYVSALYTPNQFIYIALSLLTIVAIVFSGLLLGLMLSASGMDSIIGLLVFFGLTNYAALELFVKEKKYYNAGVDNVLMLCSALLIINALSVHDYADKDLWVSSFAAVIFLWMCIRFTDTFIAMLGYASLYVCVFLLYLKTGSIARATAPFVMMGFSFFIYVLMKRFKTKDKYMFYRFCCTLVMLLTLLTFYASANYFVVRELSNEMFDLHLAEHDPMPFGWLFWILTIVIPPAYIAYGLIKKDLIFIRTGLVLIAVTVFTVRYYYNVLPAETAMLIAGLILLTVSYALLKYLKTPRYGFTTAGNGRSRKELSDAEAVINAEVFGKRTPAGSNVQFGGGSFGGGGAAGNY